MDPELQILAGAAVLSALSGCDSVSPQGGGAATGGVSPAVVEAAIAVTRFGLGARPGELAQAGRDPRAWLKAQIRPEGADQPRGELDDGPASIAAFRAYRAVRQTNRRSMAAEDAGAAAAPDAVASDAITSGAAPPSAEPADPRAARRARRAERQRRQAVEPAAAMPSSGMAEAPDSASARLRTETSARVVLAVATEAPFRERWALFWANHFTVAAVNQGMRYLVGPFEREAVRPNVFGAFGDLLLAASRHPGMLTYLDQAQSVGPGSRLGQRRGRGLNENLAREILELHTVGSDGGYTQADVTEFARALTGWSIGAPAEPEADGRFLFRPAWHEPGERRVLGRTYPEAGEAQARAILADLAADPRTARRLSRKLAAHFVADQPPSALASRLERVWLESQGDLAAVARALVDAPEAWAPAAAKVKTPYEWTVSAHRLLGMEPRGLRQLGTTLSGLAHQPFSAPSPEGWPDEAAAWATPSGLVKRLAYAELLAADAPAGLEPAQAARAALGGRLRPLTAQAVARAESRSEAFTLLLMSPEFQRR